MFRGKKHVSGNHLDLFNLTEPTLVTCFLLTLSFLHRLCSLSSSRIKKRCQSSSFHHEQPHPRVNSKLSVSELFQEEVWRLKRGDPSIRHEQINLSAATRTLQEELRRVLTRNGVRTNSLRQRFFFYCIFLNGNLFLDVCHLRPSVKTLEMRCMPFVCRSDISSPEAVWLNCFLPVGSWALCQMKRAAPGGMHITRQLSTHSFKYVISFSVQIMETDLIIITSVFAKVD